MLEKEGSDPGKVAHIIKFAELNGSFFTKDFNAAMSKLGLSYLRAKGTLEMRAFKALQQQVSVIKQSKPNTKFRYNPTDVRSEAGDFWFNFDSSEVVQLTTGMKDFIDPKLGITKFRKA